MVNKNTSLSRFTIWIILSLGMVCVVALVSYQSEVRKTRIEARMAAVVNIAGRQRMLCQRIAYLASRMMQASGQVGWETLRGELIDATSSMRKSHSALLNGNPALKMPGTNDPDIRRLYTSPPHDLDRKIFHFLSLADRLAEMPVGAVLERENAYQKFDEHAVKLLLDDLESAVLAYQNYSERQAADLVMLQSVALASTIGLVLIIGLFIFRPFIIKLNAEEDALWRRNDKLEERIRQRTEELETANQRLSAEIAERAATEELLRKGEERFALAVHGTCDGLWDWDLRTDKVWYAPRFKEMLGYGDTEFLDTLEMWDSHVHPDDRQTVVNALDDHFLDDAPYDVEFRLRTRSGEYRWFRDRGKAQRDCDGKAVRMSGSMQDISDAKRQQFELQQAREKAEAASVAKSRFLANMSHELRTPMNAILGFAQLVNQDDNLSTHQRERVSNIARSGEHLLDLINGVLELSKIEAGRMVLKTESTDLFTLLNDVELMFGGQIDECGLRYECVRDPNLPRYIMVDGGKLRQVLINLVANAIKFTGQGGGVTLRADALRLSTAEVDLSFSVEDTGQGIPECDLEAIFEDFGQSGGAVGLSDGTGLGLAISRRIVQLMGGDIAVSSTVGTGSCFRFAVKVDQQGGDAPAPAVRPSRIPASKPEYGDYRILVVDDVMINRSMLTDMLKQVGFTVFEAADGSEAIDVFNERLPHLVLMDIGMPGMNGYQTTERIKSSKMGANARIVAVTACAFDNDQRQAKESGMDGFISKPISEPELFKVIGECLKVGFVYANTSPGQPQRMETRRLCRPLDGVPEPVSNQLEVALDLADIDHVLSTIDHIAAFDREGADVLRQMANRFEYTQIIDVLRSR